MIYSVLSPNFPHQAPTIVVMARVLHAEIDPERKTYGGHVIREWSVHSNLLQLVKTVHHQFNISPPLPENAQKINPAAPQAPVPLPPVIEE